MARTIGVAGRLLTAGVVAVGLAGRSRAAEGNPAVEANENLAGRVYAAIRESTAPNTNIVIGPVGVSAAMGLTVAGAQGQTRAEMLRALGWRPQAMEPQAWRDWLGGMGKSEQGGEKKDIGAGGGPQSSALIWMRMGVWARDVGALKEGFVHEARETFGADVRPMRGDPQAVAGDVNEWFRAKDEQGGQRVVGGNGVGSSDVVVASCAEMNAGWLEGFDRAATREETFYTSAGRVQRVAMMHGRMKDCVYVEGKKWRTLVIPFWWHGASLGVALPNRGERLERVEREFVQNGVKGLLKGERVREALDVSLPRFEVEGTYDLGETFRRMGAGKAMQAGAAEFGAVENGDLWLGETIGHVARAGVAEGGLKARVWLAADEEAGNENGLAFRADRAFLFWVTEGNTGATLFVGRVCAVKESKTGQ